MESCLPLGVGGGAGRKGLVNIPARIPLLGKMLTRQNVVHTQVGFVRLSSCQWLSEIISEFPPDPNMHIFQTC